MKQKRILILTATFGMGHKSVSKAISDELSRLQGNNEIYIVDLFDIIQPKLKEPMQKGYNMLTREFEGLYNIFYEHKQEAKQNFIDQVFYKSYQKKFDQYMITFSPDVIISTFPTTSGFAARFKKRHLSETPLITVITDVVDSWEWLHEGTDYYFVPSREVARYLETKGIDKHKITVTGIPVRAAFKSNGIQMSPTPSKHVLIMSSAMGKIKIDVTFLKALNQVPDVYYTIVTGTDTELYETLNQYAFEKIRVLGYVDDIANLMKSADLIYTKPGGVTLFEAIHQQLPLVIQETSIGQETANIAFIKKRHIGISVDAPDEFIEVIKQIISNDLILKRMRNNMKKLKREFHEDAIVEVIKRAL